MVTPHPQVKEIAIWGEFYPSDVVLTMLTRPPLEVGDIIIDLQKGDRYYVQRRRTLELLGAPIEQQAQLSLIHPDDEIYQYKTSFDDIYIVDEEQIHLTTIDYSFLIE